MKILSYFFLHNLWIKLEEIAYTMLNCNYSSTERVKIVAIVQQIQKRMLVSLAQISKDLNLSEGDHLMVEERDGGIFLLPVSWIPKTQQYFWSEEWQERIKQSREDIEKGDFKSFKTAEELFADLDSDDDE